MSQRHLLTGSKKNSKVYEGNITLWSRACASWSSSWLKTHIQGSRVILWVNKKQSIVTLPSMEAYVLRNIQQNLWSMAKESYWWYEPSTTQATPLFCDNYRRLTKSSSNEAYWGSIITTPESNYNTWKLNSYVAGLKINPQTSSWRA